MTSSSIHTISGDDQIPVGRKIAILRVMQNITQQQLAQATGISQPNISRIENGSYNPTVKSLEKIAAGLNRRLEIDFI